MDVAAWLRRLGLEQYAPAFRDNDVDGEVLPQLTADDLISIGVTSVGHRRKLLAAIAALGEPPTVVQSATSAAPTPISPPTIAERRQLTVMFCDLVGSTALSTRHDPEDLRELIGDYHRAVGETVGRFDGFIAKYMGDGVLIYFGYPQAHEDDAERAVRAGLAIIEAVGRLPAREDLSVRLGIATGLAVVGDLLGEGAAQERGVVGETPNLAARLQSLAEPNMLVIGEATRRQIGEFFDLEDLGPQRLAGFAEPQHAWRVLGESGALSRFEALRSGKTPLVGRDEEIDLLLRRWDQAQAGDGRVVLISGEPGIGKSRLTATLAERIEADPHTRLRYFCSPYHQDSALYPFIVQLERAAGFARDDTAEQKLAKLEGLLAPGARDADEIDLLAELLSLPSDVADLNLSPQRKRERLFAALLHQLEAVSESRPVLMVFEDAHWIDPTSRELLDLTLDRIARLPVLLLVTFRPEFQHAWVGQANVTIMALNRLGGREGTALVQNLAGNAALDAAIVAEIVERTDGVPLFVEELTKAVLESADHENRVAAVLAASPLSSLSIPATLHASLIARLDRLGAAAKEIAQIGAVLGREFSYELIERVAQRTEADLRAGLDRLTEAGLLLCRGVAPQSSYLFKHALVQDAAYVTLLRGRRRGLHACIAGVLKNEFGAIAESRPELLAHHYSEAGQVREAVVYWGKAGHRSIARSATAEAAVQFRKGLDQLQLLPEDSSRQRQELELLTALGTVMQAVVGHASPERGRVYARARELWEQLGFPSEFLHVPYGQALYHVYCGEIASALRLGEDLLRLSRQRNDVSALVLAHNSLGRDLMLAGKFVEARTHLEEVPYLYNLVQHEALIHLMGSHFGASSQVILGNVLCFLGFYDQALKLINAAVADAEGLTNRMALAPILTFGCRMLSVYRNNALLSQRADQLFDLASEHGFRSWVAEATMYRGWAQAEDGNIEEGILLLRQGATEYRAVGNEAGMSHYISLAARAHAMAGRIDEALPLLDDALRIVEATGEGRFLAELHRHKGEFLLEKGQPESAEPLFLKALGIAREQHAKTWELRAAVRLARLWADQRRRTEAVDLLAPVYGWFTEGFDTADLKEAKALLDQLT